MRVLVFVAASSGLRQSELLGLRWSDVDWRARRIRVRNPLVHDEFSSDGKSDPSTRRSVPMADEVHDALAAWHERTVYGDADRFVFAHPEAGTPLDRSEATRYLQSPCVAARCTRQ